MHPDCEFVIQQAWNHTVNTGSPMYRLFEKIKNCRNALVRWSKATFGQSKNNLQEKHRILEELIKEHTVAHLEEIRRVKDEINTILYHDELHWRQRSRSIWMKAGDKNTKFFHQRASQRLRKNNISGIFDGGGVWHESEEGIARAAESYFHELFTSANPSDMNNVLNSVDRVVTPETNQSVLQNYTVEEVHRALFQMHPSKSPGSNGMSPFFFQKFWHIVGVDVTNAVLSVLQSGRMLQKMNFTHIVLVPKKNEPMYMSDFRPSSLENVVARIISKVITNRLKMILPNIISDAQSAFISARLITDNTIVAFEVLHRMRNKRSGKKGQMAVKLDISKAYDRMEWSFLRQMMLKLGFDGRWVNFAMETVCTASYSILINGEPRGFVQPSQGIKQGDPLSPYLFLLCAEGLFGMIRRAVENREIHGVLSCPNGVCISHLLFADDSFLFCEALIEECQRLMDIIGRYEAASGQAINRQKTSLFFSRNTREEAYSTTDCHRYYRTSPTNSELHCRCPAQWTAAFSEN
ncbi:hypothetical protein SO802_033983 [Lithocarpus litseifolius]|uniref:Reverse transcriptase domain-containing protein n=1 Tax=Lithocarpus litseifolius TaxID=425828 RepID=A0AAW2BFZ0_9ROSI